MTRAGVVLGGRPVLVTGASGFLGSHVTRRLVREGAEVHALVRRAGGARLADVRPFVTEHEADVADAAAVTCCVARARPEVVFHLAVDTASRRFGAGDWTTVDRSITVNLRGTLHVLRAALECGSVRTFVRAGTLEEYGNGPVPHDETQREEPVSPYSASLVATTHFCQALQRHMDSAVVTLRPTLLYGPSQAADFFIPAVILACLRGEEFAIRAVPSAEISCMSTMPSTRSCGPLAPTACTAPSWTSATARRRQSVRSPRRSSP